jgi:hypothetical protein
MSFIRSIFLYSINIKEGNKDILEGYITIFGARHAANTSFSRETDDGFVYHFIYRGLINEAVKIVDSLIFFE